MKTETPLNIDSLTVEEVLQLVPDNPFDVEGLPSKKKRYKLLKLLYDVMGYELTNDVILATLYEGKRQLILATAGGGKTTNSQVKVILEKIFRKNIYGLPLDGDRVLCLVYNTHNVEQMRMKHSDMVSKLYMSGVKGLEIDSLIRPHTVHSFCEYWKREFSSSCGLEGWKLLEESDIASLFRQSIDVIRKKYNIQDQILTGPTQNLYNYIKENLLEFDDMDDIDMFIETGVEKNVMIDIFNLYESTKNRKRVYDYTDMVYKVYEMIRDNEHIRNNIREYYQYVTVDEVQDFTPLMIALLQQIVGDSVPMVCIGDEDQAIYGFRGADINTVMKFQTAFEGGKVFVLNKNRRCGSAIVDKASVIIKSNENRYEKDLKATNKGGQVILKPYRTEKGQIINLFEYIKSLSSEEQSGLAVTYRDRIYSMQLVEMLESANIPFNVISGYQPFTHELYKHVENVLDILYRPYNRIDQLNMYKVLPMTKSEWYELMGYDPSKKRFKGSDPGLHFAQLDYGKYNVNEKVRKDLQDLLNVSSAMNTAPMESYFDIIFEKIVRNFWKTKMEMNDRIDVDAVFTDKVREFFNRNQVYEDVFKDLAKRRERCQAWTDKKIGITFSTFHGLKGLEFDEVHMIYMNNNIFPNFSLIDMKDISDEVKQDLKEAETRLCYVAMTRPRHKLVMHYPVENPSIYITMLMADAKKREEEKELAKQNKSKLMELSLGDDDIDDEAVTSTTNFDFTDKQSTIPQPVQSKTSILGRFFD